MRCRKCKGRYFIDRAYCTHENIEIACLTCGNRKFLNPRRNALGRWLQTHAKI